MIESGPVHFHQLSQYSCMNLRWPHRLLCVRGVTHLRLFPPCSVGVSFCSLYFRSWGWANWGQLVVLLKTGTKMVLSISDFSSSYVMTPPPNLWSMIILSTWVFLLTYLYEGFVFHTFSQIKFLRVLALLIFSLHNIMTPFWVLINSRPELPVCSSKDDKIMNKRNTSRHTSSLSLSWENFPTYNMD